jgi:hypothetical protein
MKAKRVSIKIAATRSASAARAWRKVAARVPAFFTALILAAPLALGRRPQPTLGQASQIASAAGLTTARATR